MLKKKLYIQILLIFQCLSMEKFEQFQINFDYSHLNIEDLYISNIIKVEFNKLIHYFKELLLYPNYKYLYRMNIKNKDKVMICNNVNISLKYEKESIDKKTFLLVFPIITINSNSTRKNNPILIECLKKDTNSNAIILDFEFNSEKQMKRVIPLNLENQKYQWKAIQYIFSSIGFNKNSFSIKNIKNNILLNNITALENNSLYKTFKKFSFLTNLTYKKSNQTENFLDFWPSFPNFHDVMIEGMNPRIFQPTITEMTIEALKKLGYIVNQCELILYRNKCFRVNQKCLNAFNYDDYFLEYTMDTKNNRWICFYKTEEHFKNKQCSNDYGVLLSNDEVRKKLLINFLRKEDFQTIRLLKPAPSCPKPHPRTVFYMTVKEKEDPYQYKIVDRVEEVTIKDPNYFIITDTFSYNYNVKYRAATYNNILTHSNKNWNYNYLWMFYNHYSQNSGINLKNNKYQLEGKFPLDNTYKDGLNRFYNKQKAKFPEDYNYIPETYIFPDQKNEIFEKFRDYHYNPKDVWLFKPARNSFGYGIKIIDNYNDIKDDKNKRYLISRYIMNTLLINNKKFDMRAYILVTGMNPLKIYFYRDGYLKISVKDFTLAHEHINDGCIHITTSDTNLKCFEGKEYKNDKDIYDEKSHFWSFVYFERYCNKHGINYTDIIEQMKDIFIKTFISLNSNFIDLMKERNKYDRNTYQLYGLDLIVCDYINDNLITDLLNIVGIVPFNHNETQQTLDKNIYEYDNEIEEIVDDCLCEFGRPRGMFELIYPLKDNINKYKKFYEIVYPESQLLWNKLLESNGEYD